jgi:hypothetical protein
MKELEDFIIEKFSKSSNTPSKFFKILTPLSKEGN